MKCNYCGASVEANHKCEYCGNICEATEDKGTETGQIYNGDLNISGVNGDYKYSKLIIKGNINVSGVNNNIECKGKGSKVMTVLGNLNVYGVNNDIYGVYCEGAINDNGANNDINI